MPNKTDLDYQKINMLIDAIEAGDTEAMAEAQTISAKLSKRANVRMKALEEKGYTSGMPYMSAKHFLEEDLGRGKFSESKHLEGRELVRNLELVNEFLNQGTTIAEEKFRRSGLDVSREYLPADMTAAQKKQLQKFFASPAWKEYKSTIYIHEQKSRRTPAESARARRAIFAASSAIRSGARVSQLEKMYSKYQEQTKTGADTDIYGVMEEWAEF